jgi:hypothetical protein
VAAGPQARIHSLAVRLAATSKELIMVEKTGVYAICKAKVQAIEAAYDQIAQAIEAYQATLNGLIAQADPADEDEQHLLVTANLQLKTANGLLNTVETDLNDDLIRLSDRVIRFKHWEDGVFV